MHGGNTFLTFQWRRSRRKEKSNITTRWLLTIPGAHDVLLTIQNESYFKDNSYVDFYFADQKSYISKHFDGLSLKKKYARTNVFEYSYFNRIVDSWNQLPRDISDDTRVTSFKSKIKDFLMKWYCEGVEGI